MVEGAELLTILLPAAGPSLLPVIQRTCMSNFVHDVVVEVDVDAMHLGGTRGAVITSQLLSELLLILVIFLFNIQPQIICNLVWRHWDQARLISLPSIEAMVLAVVERFDYFHEMALSMLSEFADVLE